MTNNNRYNISGIKITESNGDVHLDFGDISTRIMTPRQADELAKSIRQASAGAQRTRANMRQQGHTASYTTVDEGLHGARASILTLKDFEDDPTLTGIDKNGKKISYVGVKAALWVTNKSGPLRKLAYPGLNDEQIFQKIFGPVTRDQ